MEDLYKPGLYRHFKGGEYRLLFLATHSETSEALVVYHPVSTPENYWVRPRAMWYEMVEHDGKNVRRFSYIGE